LPKVLEALDIKKYFDFVIVSHEAKSEKPDSKIFTVAMQAAKLAGKNQRDQRITY
jgi:FMN phosphatase YigB (HAD superfamily)